eukprot:CAMPEP_0117506314 /NCGR_PEP_ID=MMETSP0784-20121206/25844_1 /TAXON_ID=39447 /ORGANISM="" /LENGTH=535 /DNA_ID=CAMNT_0005301783 /DNA_START=59 /DNA_END=1666 /DNA_ORIENTATION=-
MSTQTNVLHAANPPVEGLASARIADEWDTDLAGEGLEACAPQRVRVHVSTPAVRAAPSVSPAWLRKSLGTPSCAMERRLIVRSSHRWRVYAEPSLSARVLGTVASGTIVFLPPSSASQLSKNNDVFWVEAIRFQSHEQYGVMLTHDNLGRGMYCLRRDREGNGLYGSEAEALEGLDDELWRQLAPESEVRDTRNAPLTSMLLQAFENARSVVRSCSPVPLVEEEGLGKTTTISGRAAQNPSMAFESRQHAQVLQAVQRLSQASEALASAYKEASLETASGLPQEMPLRFRLIGAALSEASTRLGHGLSAFPGSTRGCISREDLYWLAEALRRLEQCRVFSALGRDLQLEVVNFSQEYAKHMEDQCGRVRRGLAKAPDRGACFVGARPTSGGLGAFAVRSRSAQGEQKPCAVRSAAVLHGSAAPGQNPRAADRRSPTGRKVHHAGGACGAQAATAPSQAQCAGLAYPSQSCQLRDCSDAGVRLGALQPRTLEGSRSAVLSAHQGPRPARSSFGNRVAAFRSSAGASKQAPPQRQGL